MSGAKIFGIIGLALTGIIIADLMIHPQGVTAVTNGLNKLQSTTGNQMLGQAA